jgi:succinoglycan biosynthesis transport protein ExoP
MKFEEQAAKGILEVLSPVKVALQRYWGISWAPALAVALLVGILSVRLPDYYVADVTIFIQPQRIASKIIEAPEKEDNQERLEALIHEILSRPRLRAIIDQFGLYPEYSGIVGREKALKLFRNAFKLEPLKSFAGKELVQTFKIEYAHEDPKMAFEVSKALSNTFIEESIVSERMEREGTVEFLDAQLRAARKRLEETEDKVQEFIRNNFGRLPEHLDQSIQRLQTARQQYATNSQMISANVQRLSYLQRELKLTAQETAYTTGESGTIDASDPRSAVAQLERALGVLKSKYSDKHPEVIAVKDRIKMLQDQIRAEGGDAAAAGPAFKGSSEVRLLRREMSELEVQTTGLKAENEDLKGKIAKLEEDINAMPLKEQELVAIKRDYDNVRKSYEELASAREEAGLQSSIIRSQKGTQFKIVNPPSLPVIPAGPQRLLIAGVGFTVALLLFFTIPLALHFLNDSFKFRDDVENDLEVQVLGIIPPMKTPAARALERRANTTALLAAVLAFFGGGVLIFFVV